MQGVDPFGRSAHIHAVVRYHVEIDVTDLVHRANEVLLLVPGQVAHVDHAEAAVGDQDADGLRVLRRIDRPHLEIRAFGVRLAGAGERRVDHLAAGGEDFDVEALDRDRVAGLHQDVRPFLAEGGVFVVQHLRGLVVFDARAVVHEIADGQFLGELPDAAHVVGVVVSGDQVVDFLDARHLGGGRDA